MSCKTRHFPTRFQHEQLRAVFANPLQIRRVIVVGYQNIDMHDAKQALACGFVSIGATEGDGVYLTDLIPDCESSAGDIVIEMLNEYGIAKEDTFEVYSYYKNAFGKDDGWYDFDDNFIEKDENDVFFPVGTGFWVTGMDDTTWRTAGQVYEADKSIPLNDGKQMLANPYATSIFLDRDIQIDCDSSAGDIVIEMLNEYGIAKEDTFEVYSYYKNAFGKDDGWYDFDDNQIIAGENDVEFPAGQGLWVTGMDDTAFMITSPLK